MTHPNVAMVGCHPAGSAVPPTVSAPLIGRVSCPRIPMAAQARHEARVNPTIHGLRRRRASETAPSTGTDRTIRMDETPFPTAYTVFDACRSAINQTEKYSVATFIEKMVFAKSYSAQLARSTRGARDGERAPAGNGNDAGSCMDPRILIDGTSRRPKLPSMPHSRLRVARRPHDCVVLLLLLVTLPLAACERR